MTEEDAGTYVCKATSEVGMAVTKAKLFCTGKINASCFLLTTKYFLIYGTMRYHGISLLITIECKS